MGAYSYQQDPGNEYLLTTSRTGWVKLSEFWAMPKEELYSNWKEIIEAHEKSNGHSGHFY